MKNLSVLCQAPEVHEDPATELAGKTFDKPQRRCELAVQVNESQSQDALRCRASAAELLPSKPFSIVFVANVR